MSARNKKNNTWYYAGPYKTFTYGRGPGAITTGGSIGNAELVLKYKVYSKRDRYRRKIERVFQSSVKTVVRVNGQEKYAFNGYLLVRRNELYAGRNKLHTFTHQAGRNYALILSDDGKLYFYQSKNPKIYDVFEKKEIDNPFKCDT
jgi:hypothetical protein